MASFSSCVLASLLFFATEARADDPPVPIEKPPVPVPVAGRFFFVVRDVHVIAGRGVVAEGQVIAGTVRNGDELSIQGPEASFGVRVHGIEAFQKLIETANAGDFVGMLLKLRNGGDPPLQRGMLLEGGPVEPPPAADPKFAVTLHCASGSVVGAIRVVRELTGLSLAEAKSLVEHPPAVVLQGATHEEADAALRKLTAAGAAATMAHTGSP